MEEQAAYPAPQPPEPPPIDKLATALAQAQGEFQPVARTGKNPHLKNEYATLDDIISAIRKPLATHGLSFVQLLNSNGDGALTLCTRLLHESGQYIESMVQIHVASGNRAINDLQAVGAAITYMKRYTISAMLGIAADTDGDGEGAKPRRQPQQQHQAQPSAPASTRPLPAEAIRKIVRKKAGWGDTRDVGGEPVTEKQIGFVAMLLQEAVDTDGTAAEEINRRRHAVLEYLVGVDSTKKLQKSEASAIIDWLTQPDSGQMNEYASREAAAVVAAWLRDQGQLDMEM